MRSVGIVGGALFFAAMTPLFYGCADVAGVKDREVTPTGSGGGGGGGSGGGTGGSCAALDPGTLPQPTVLAEGENHPLGIVLDAKNVYWINEGDPDNGGSGGGGGAQETGGAVRKGPKEGGAAVDLVLTAPTKPHLIGLDGDQVYWVTTDRNSCSDANPDRDKLLRISSDPAAGELPALVWSSCGRPEGIAFDGTNVYLARPKASRVQSVDKFDLNRDDVFTEDMQETSVTEPWGVAVDSQFVYCTDAKSGKLLTYKKSDQSKAVLVKGDPAGDQPMPISIDEQSVYWLTNHGVLRSAKTLSSGSDGVKLNAEDIVKPAGLAVHKGYVYFTDSNAGTVSRVPANKCSAPVTIATSQGSPTALAVDDSGVYWTNFQSGQIMKLPLPQQ